MKDVSLRLLKEMNIVCSSNIKERHDWISSEISKIDTPNQKIRYSPIWKSFKKFLEEKNENIIVPKSTLEIQNWGQSQHHCLGSYASHVKKGKGFVCQFEDEEKDYHALYALYQRSDNRLDLVLEQFRGKYNEIVPIKLKVLEEKLRKEFIATILSKSLIANKKTK